MSAHPFLLLEVFAASPGSGNLLPVILDADDVTDERMALVALRMRQSETSFVQTATDPDATYRHRIWTVVEELPFAGHPSVGSAVAVALQRGDSSATYTQQTRVGLQRLDVTIAADRRSGHAALHQAALQLGPVVDPTDLLRALGLDVADAHPDLPAQVVSTGLPALVIPLRTTTALGRARMDPGPVGSALAALPLGDAGAHKALNCYLATPVDTTRAGEPSAPSAPVAEATTWRTRCLALDLPGYEDPATGSAAGPFAAWVAVRGGPTRVHIIQGVEMGDRSDIDVDTNDGIVVSGQVLVRATGSIEL
ncbi:MAG: PhzF family phenazine biosynthesis protein [Chloroflexi bacterium]|nr:PhzF family phenazine biosynthesis protein [Chloroflexota bacterium]